MSTSNHSLGLMHSVLASLLFGIIPWYLSLLAPVDGTYLFWNRIIFSFVSATVVMLCLRKTDALLWLLARPQQMLWLTVGAVLIGFQWWLFVWAPVNGRATELSQGYFLLPLTLVLVGRMLYNEQLRRSQWVAVVLAGIGVAHELYQEGSLSWVALAVALGYPFYFIVRKKVAVHTLIGFWFENALLMPVGLWLLGSDAQFWQIIQAKPQLYLLLPGLGFITTIAMQFYISSSRLLSVSLFGLLSYLEPALLFMVAVLVLHEPLSAEQWVTYGFVWLATFIVCIDSIKHLRRADMVASPS